MSVGGYSYGVVKTMAEDEASSKNIVIKIFGEELGDKLALAAGYGKRKDYRGVLEPTAPTTQCERAGHPFKPDMPCYLCGLPIPDKKLLSGSEDELWVECEHIFPVTEARWYLDLYMSTRPPDDAWTRRAIELEYAQAHRVCNQAKSNFSFIKDEGGRPVVSRVGIQKVLKNIQIRARGHVGNYQDQRLSYIMRTIADTILTRAPIIEKIVENIIGHVNEVALGDPNMVLLMRTSLLVDPSSLSAGVREVYDKWNTGSAGVREYKENMFQKFLEETYSVYPQLRPESIVETVSVPAEYRRFIEPKFVQDTMRRFFEIQKIPDPTGKALLSTVYYGVYMSLFNELSRNITDRNAPYICNLYQRMNIVQQNEPNVKNIFGPVPTAPRGFRERCEIITGKADRDIRNIGRELTDEDMGEEQPTVQEEAAYFLNGLQTKLERQLANTGIAGLDASLMARQIEQQAVKVFIDTFPEGRSRAIEAAAEHSDTLIRLTLVRFPEHADKIATFAFNYILANRRDETKTYGGKARRALYSNIQRKRVNTRHIRRSSRRTRRTYRK